MKKEPLIDVLLLNMVDWKRVMLAYQTEARIDKWVMDFMDHSWSDIRSNYHQVDIWSLSYRGSQLIL